MTFKHIKFEDSEVMRSLEKVGVSKGLVKEAKATKSINDFFNDRLKPSGNLTQDIMKLCNGLRAEGFETYATELEGKFLAFKKADSLYQTSKEKGEDLVDAAHPDGSHKLKGVLGDNVVETVVDRHLAFLDVVNKKPTGKLASRDIMNAMKYALGQEAAPAAYEETAEEADSDVYNFIFAYRYLVGCRNYAVKANKHLVQNVKSAEGVDDFNAGDVSKVVVEINKFLTKFAAINNIKNVTGRKNYLKSEEGKSLLDELTEPEINKLIKYINFAKGKLAPKEGVTKPETNEARTYAMQVLDQAIAQAEEAKNIISNKRKDEATKYCKEEMGKDTDAAKKAQEPTEAQKKLKEMQDRADEQTKLKPSNDLITDFRSALENMRKKLGDLNDRIKNEEDSGVDYRAPANSPKSKENFAKYKEMMTGHISSLTTYYLNKVNSYIGKLIKIVETEKTPLPQEKIASYREWLIGIFNESDPKGAFNKYYDDISANTFAKFTPGKDVKKADDGKVSRASARAMVRAIKSFAQVSQPETPPAPALTEDQKKFAEAHRVDFMIDRKTKALESADKAKRIGEALKGGTNYTNLIDNAIISIKSFDPSNPIFSLLENAGGNLYNAMGKFLKHGNAYSELKADCDSIIANLDHAKNYVSHMRQAAQGGLDTWIFKHYESAFKTQEKTKAETTEAAKKDETKKQQEALLKTVTGQLVRINRLIREVNIISELPKAKNNRDAQDWKKSQLQALNTIVQTYNKYTQDDDDNKNEDYVNELKNAIDSEQSDIAEIGRWARAK